jgi:hypothetical protein
MPSSCRQISAIDGKSSGCGAKPVSKDAVRCLFPGSGHIECRHPVDGLAVDPHDFAAGRQNGGTRAQLHHGLDHACDGINQMLAVVEHE